MALLDIEKGIELEGINSRFKLCYIASKRAKELHNDGENVLPPQVKGYYKNTTIALAEIIDSKIIFTELDTDE